jgi:AraC family transcriptional regulator of adaptative response/methylated-DNA-[protein]-cysteine methyltransferase
MNAPLSEQALLDYERITRAIQYIETHHLRQPDLAEVAEHVHLSSFHFQRLFSRWAGISPQRFMRFLTKEYAKEQLLNAPNLLDASEQVALSSPSRLHDLFVTYEAMTPAEFRALGKGLCIRYGLHPSPFGWALVACTSRGITDLHFVENVVDVQPILSSWMLEFSEAVFCEDVAATAPFVQALFGERFEDTSPLHMILRGTNFQIKVWEALLRIPVGGLVSYDSIARQIGQPTASRAVGTAIGSNRIAFLIPCHRVLQKSGALGGYRWGTVRKQALMAYEGAKAEG